MSTKSRATAQANNQRLINVVQPRTTSAEEERDQILRYGGTFMVRIWFERDDPYGHEEANLYDMIGSTVVYATGETNTVWDPVGMACLRNTVLGAMAGGGSYCFFNRSKVDRRRADRLAERVGLKLDGDIQINQSIKYIHAPGTFVISDGELIVFKDFCEENIPQVWRKFLRERRNLIEIDFRLNDVARRRKHRLRPRIFVFRLFTGEKRPKGLIDDRDLRPMMVGWYR